MARARASSAGLGASSKMRSYFCASPKDSLKAELQTCHSSIHFTASDPDLVDFSGIPDVLQRIGVEEDEIGAFAFLESPEVSGDFQSLGGIRSCRQQCLRGSQSCLHHELQLPMLEEYLKTGGRAGVGAQGNRDSRIPQLLQVLLTGLQLARIS